MANHTLIVDRLHCPRRGRKSTRISAQAGVWRVHIESPVMLHSRAVNDWASRWDLDANQERDV